jgi:hypothetical protein
MMPQMPDEIVAEAEAIFVAHPELLSRFLEAMATVFREAHSLARTRPPLFAG